MKMQPKHLKSFWSKKNIFLVSLILVLTVGLGITFAWLTGSDDETDYLFAGVEATCQTVNSYNNIAVQNTCDISEHIRVKMITNYRKQLENNTYGNLFYTEPVHGTDYTITFNETDWVRGDDGYYYYRYPVAPNATTAQLVTSFNVLTNPPEGYELRVEYLCEAIQVIPNGRPATEAWGAMVDGNNNITGASGFSN